MAEKKANPNLVLYDLARQVPSEAVKSIPAGKLKGYSNINPMYRIKRLTEMFGPCGDPENGWSYRVLDQRLFPVPDLNEVYVFTDIELWYTKNGVKSDPIPGCGGNCLIANTRNGIQVNDEAYKMSLTDALSVAAKSLGVGADIYWGEDRSKYDAFQEQPNFYASRPDHAPSKAQKETAAPKVAPNDAPSQSPIPSGGEQDPRTVIFPFGKYKGVSVGETAARDKGYLKYLLDNAGEKLQTQQPVLYDAIKKLA